jgi:hypothetical protein
MTDDSWFSSWLITVSRDFSFSRIAKQSSTMKLRKNKNVKLTCVLMYFSVYECPITLQYVKRIS